MATLKDIAAGLDVSIALVSKVVSGRMGNTGCSAATRAAILAKAHQLGYRPHPLAVALRTGRRAAIGVFLHPLGEVGSGLTESLLIGIAETLNRHNQRLWLTFYQRDQQFIQHCSQSGRLDVDGVIVAGIAHRQLAGPIRKLEKSGVPVVTVVSGSLSPDIVNVYSDEREQTYLSTSHLIARGCRRIAHVNSFKERLAGYRQALRDAQLPFDPALVYHAANFKLHNGTAAVRHWLKHRVTFDGVVAQSDHHALGVIHELLRRGVQVPAEVRVIGIDNSPLCLASPVALSSVSQEMPAIGRLAVNLLLQRLAGEPVKSVTVPPQLQIRAST